MDRGVRLGNDHNGDYNHATDGEYKRLRQEADQLHQKRQHLSSQSQQAYKNGDKAKAKEFSDQAKKVGQQAEDANIRAAEYVFRENNTDSAGDEIDLHGLYVKEAEFILQRRIGNDIRTNQSHINVIVGKGLHSANGIAKLKPAVTAMCDEAGLKHHMDSKNSGVLVIDLTNTQASQIPNNWAGPAPQQSYQPQQQSYQPQQHAQPQYQQQQQQQGYQQQQGNNNNSSNDLVSTLVNLICACLKSK